MQVQVVIKDVYGKPTIYPVCEKAKMFAELVGQKTLTSRDVNYIKKLGYTVQVKQQPVNL